MGNPDDEAMRLAEENVEDSSSDPDSLKLVAHVRRLVAELAEAKEAIASSVEDRRICEAISEENERMRKGLEGIVRDSDTKTAVMLGVQIVGRIHRTALDSLTPAPAVETKPKCGTCRGARFVAVGPNEQWPCPDCAAKGET